MTENEVSGYAYVPIEDDETYEDAWDLVSKWGPRALVTNFDDIERGQRAYIFRVTIHHEDIPQPPPQVDVEVPLGVEAMDNWLRGSREDLLLLARTIHDILEGGS